MKKTIAVICIAVTLALAVALTVILIMGISGKQVFNWDWRIGDVRIDAFNGGRAELVKEDSISLSDARSMELLSDQGRIYVRAIDGDRMVVRQYSTRDLNKEDEFRMSQSGGHVLVDARRPGFRISIFSIVVEERIEVDVPRDWIGNVVMSSTSGGIRVQDDFEWELVSLKSTSGGITIERSLVVERLAVDVSSGGIKLEGAVAATDEVVIKSTSGGIKTESIDAKRVEISCSSGGIKLGDITNADDVKIKSTSGSTSMRYVEAGNFDISSSSGGVKIDELNGAGRVYTTSGGIKIDFLNPSGNVELKASSGGIKAEVPRDLRHFISTSTTSGSVKIEDR